MNKSSLKRIVGAAVLSAVCSLLFALASAGSASAEVTCVECGSWWGLTAASMPTDLAPGGEGRISVTAEDLGDQGVSSTVVLKDKLPAGLSAQSVALSLGVGGLGLGNSPVEFLGAFLCNVQSSEVTCTVTEEFLALFQNTEFNLATPYSHIEAWINVKVAETAKSGEMNDVSISGGGAPAVSVQRPLTVSTQPTPFGVEQYELRPENADGSIDTQAGSHPFQLTTVDNLNQGVNGPPEAVKDLRFNTPPGLVGNPTPFPQCPLAKFTNIFREGNMCPDNTVVGIASVTIKALDGDPEGDYGAVVLARSGGRRTGALRVRRRQCLGVSRHVGSHRQRLWGDCDGAGHHRAGRIHLQPCDVLGGARRSAPRPISGLELPHAHRRLAAVRAARRGVATAAAEPANRLRRAGSHRPRNGLLAEQGGVPRAFRIHVAGWVRSGA